MTSIFVSYKWEDRACLEKLIEWRKKGLLGNKIGLSYEKKDLRQEGKFAFKKEVNPKISSAAAVIFLIGDDTHSAFGVQAEIDTAISQQKRMIAVRIPDTDGGLPQDLLDQDVDEIPFHPDSLIKYFRNNNIRYKS